MSHPTNGVCTMVTSDTTKRDIAQVESTQLFDGIFYDTADVLRELAREFRIACGIAPLDRGAKIHEAEAQMIFTLCYVCHNGLSADWKTRARRSLKDLYEYLDDRTRHELPYYVIRTHHLMQATRSCDTKFPSALIQVYKQVITLMSGPVADHEFLESHRLPAE